MSLSEFAHLLDQPGVIYGQRCALCNGLEEADGSLGIEVAEGQFNEVPIGENCLEKMRASNANWLDKPEEGVLE